jgi:hypothetical protein
MLYAVCRPVGETALRQGPESSEPVHPRGSLSLNTITALGRDKAPAGLHSPSGQPGYRLRLDEVKQVRVVYRTASEMHIPYHNHVAPHVRDGFSNRAPSEVPLSKEELEAMNGRNQAG